jgi:acyl carrier protein
MSPEAARAAMVEALAEVAPEVDPATLEPQVPLQEQIELDSMDFLGFVVALNELTGVEIPERDYPRMATPEACIAYLVAHSAP